MAECSPPPSMKRASSRSSAGARSRSALTRRAMIKGVAGLGATAALSGCSVLRPRASATREPLRSENERPGTRDWMLQHTGVDPETKYRCPWIEGYCSHASVRAGQTLTFHVSTRPPSRFNIEIYRMGYYAGAGGRFLR